MPPNKDIDFTFLFCSLSLSPIKKNKQIDANAFHSFLFFILDVLAFASGKMQLGDKVIPKGPDQRFNMAAAGFNIVQYCLVYTSTMPACSLLSQKVHRRSARGSII